MSQVGVDIGQKNDPTTIVVADCRYEVVKASARSAARLDSHFSVRLIETLPLGTPYPEVARRIGEIWRGLVSRPNGRPQIYIDATGVGLPVVDLARSYIASDRDVWAVVFNHGDHRTESQEERKVVLGKAFLVARLQILLQAGRIHLPQTAEAKKLAQELLDYEIRIDQDANDRYGAFKVGTHDDLVTALGLAVQIDPKRPPISMKILAQELRRLGRQPHF
jgi:hypothetical protein